MIIFGVGIASRRHSKSISSPTRINSCVHKSDYYDFGKNPSNVQKTSPIMKGITIEYVYRQGMQTSYNPASDLAKTTERAPSFVPTLGIHELVVISDPSKPQSSTPIMFNPCVFWSLLAVVAQWSLLFICYFVMLPTDRSQPVESHRSQEPNSNIAACDCRDRTKCVSAQKQVKKAMTSENINILNPMIILFSAVSVIAPVFDSVYRSINHAD